MNRLIIHKNGTVSYWSVVLGRRWRSLPGNVLPEDRAALTEAQRAKLDAHDEALTRQFTEMLVNSITS